MFFKDFNIFQAIEPLLKAHVPKQRHVSGAGEERYSKLTSKYLYGYSFTL